MTIVALHNLTRSLYTSRIRTKQAVLNNNLIDYLSTFGRGDNNLFIRDNMFIIIEGK